jgi:chorismate--pyruvate lyase
MHPQIISKWIDKEMLLNENISAEILSWLLEEKSITQRIMKDYSFSLELISTKEEIISSEEKAFLGNTEDKIQVRRVKLIANDKSLIPSLTSKHGFDGLSNLGKQPLGDLIFQSQIFVRTKIFFAKFKYKNCSFWGRITIFDVNSYPMTIMEVFLIE